MTTSGGGGGGEGGWKRIERRRTDIADMNRKTDEYWELRNYVDTHQSGPTGPGSDAKKLEGLEKEINTLRKRLGLPDFDTINPPEEK